MSLKESTGEVPLYLRARAKLRSWQRHASPRVVTWIKEGVKVPLLGKLEPFDRTIRWRKTGFMMEEGGAVQAAESEVQRLLKSGVLEKVEVGQALFVSPIFVVPKPGQPGKWRLIHDLRWLNEHCVPALKFKQEKIGNLEYLACPGDEMISWDMLDGFYMVGIHPDHRKYFQFELNGEIYQYTALPMGWTWSPYIYHKCMRPFVKLLRKRGLKIHDYVDDLLAIFQAGHGPWAQTVIQRTLAMFGLARKVTKGCWEPTTRLQHLGLIIDLKEGTVQPTPERRQQFIKLGNKLRFQSLRRRRTVECRLLQRYLGVAQFLAIGAPELLTWARPLYAPIRPAVRKEVRLSGAQIKRIGQMSRWVETYPTWKLWKEPTRWLVTDASQTGWGAFVQDNQGQILGSSSGLWGPMEGRYHITRKEQKSIKKGVLALGAHLVGHDWGEVTDASAVVGTMSKRCSRSPAMQKEVTALTRVLHSLGISWPVSLLKVGTKENRYADALSRRWIGGALVGATQPLKILSKEVGPILRSLIRNRSHGVPIRLPEWQGQAWFSLLSEFKDIKKDSSLTSGYQLVTSLDPSLKTFMLKED